MRIVDAFLSLPWILKMLVLIVTFGTGLEVLILHLPFSMVFRWFDARAATHDVIARDFVWAAKARGRFGSASSGGIAAQCSGYADGRGRCGGHGCCWPFPRSHSGFGVSPPPPDWGLMISDARDASFAPWGVIGPVVALSSLIIGINLTADALAKALGIDRAQKAPV